LSISNSRAEVTLERRAVVVDWRDVEEAVVVDFESSVVAFEEVAGRSVVVKGRAVRAAICDSEERRVGSMEVTLGLFDGRGGRRGSEVGGRRRDSQVCRSVWRLWIACH
jgi:hypothetical protein